MTADSDEPLPDSTGRDEESVEDDFDQLYADFLFDHVHRTISVVSRWTFSPDKTTAIPTSTIIVGKDKTQREFYAEVNLGIIATAVLELSQEIKSILQTSERYGFTINTPISAEQLKELTSSTIDVLQTVLDLSSDSKLFYDWRNE